MVLLTAISEGGTMGDIYINQRLRQSPNGYIWRDPADGILLLLRNTEYRKIGSVLPSIIWDGMEMSHGMALSLGFAFTARTCGLCFSIMKMLC